MLLSTSANALMEALGDHKAIGVLAGVGFDCLDFSVDEILNGAEDHPLKENGFRAYAEALLDTAEHCGIFFNQAHAVFPSFEEGLGSKNDKLFVDTLRSIEIAGVLKARQIVIHPFSHSGGQAQRGPGGGKRVFLKGGEPFKAHRRADRGKPPPLRGG